MNIKARINRLESALQAANETGLVRLIIAYPEDGPISVTAPPSVIDAMDKAYGDPRPSMTNVIKPSRIH